MHNQVLVLCVILISSLQYCVAHYPKLLCKLPCRGTLIAAVVNCNVSLAGWLVYLFSHQRDSLRVTTLMFTKMLRLDVLQML